MASLRTLVFITLLATALVTPPASATPTQAIPIATARTLPLGTVVTVHGTVTTQPGAFESSFFDKGFALQDASAGIYISLPTKLDAKPGHRARVTGTLRDSFGLLILVPTTDTDVTLGHPGPPIPPKWVPTSGVNESTEGRLVRVFGKVTQTPTSDLPFGHKFWVDDGSGEVQVFVNLETGIDVTTFHPGQRMLITGFSGQFNADYEILPRSPHDIRTH
ncbi:single stranded DNA-binding domain-containing protein [Actinokineospora iranica]|uniref:OB-fold nucleic acid binding domain-containing protein n=1 Tax=Actinokineospora iranica TaxID=1271860 RepID=A0A1G6XPW7_9PSEU|nr:hypothetical protein [Actinokineospora iranica]SDD79356.1 hypothetical protein SAMN05216174_11830 [Actinokineospora iranica]